MFTDNRVMTLEINEIKYAIDKLEGSWSEITLSYIYFLFLYHCDGTTPIKILHVGSLSECENYLCDIIKGV